MRVLGVDEAGRGCVFGPLVVAGFVVDDVGDDALREAGAADSKRLSPARRQAARVVLDELGTAVLRGITPEAIDRGNLNRLEEAAIVDIVREVRPDRVYVDAMGSRKTASRLATRLAGQVGFDAEWVVEPKADATWPVVGAASIFAKTTRDAALDALREQWGDLGSGYPSDPTTRAWMTTWAATGEPWPDFVRTRWGTVCQIAQQVMFGGG